MAGVALTVLLVFGVRVLFLVNSVAQQSALLWTLVRPARPMQMRWSLSVYLTERASDTLGFSPEQRSGLQAQLGELTEEDDDWGFRKPRFKGHPAPAWTSKPITVEYERWGDSLERWRVRNGLGFWGSDELDCKGERVVELLPSHAETKDVWIAAPSGLLGSPAGLRRRPHPQRC